MTPEAAVHWTTTGMFWITVVMAVLTITATSISYLIYRAATDPNVVVYATLDERRPSIILLVIENIGKGIAKNVTFNFKKPIPSRAFGWADAPMPAQMQEGPLITGIPALGPGARRVITWGQYGGLHKGLGDEVVDVTIRYRGEPFVFLRGQDYETVCPLEVKSFEHTSSPDHNWDKKAAEQLERIAKALEKVTDYEGLKVQVIRSEAQEGIQDGEDEG